MPETLRRLRTILTALFALVLCWPLLIAFPINGGDALWVAESSRALVSCVRNNVWTECPGTYQFGWLQHIPAMFFAWKGLGDETIVLLLTLLNFMAMVWLISRLIKQSQKLTGVVWLLLGAITLGPLYAFSVYSFSESLSFVLMAALVIYLSSARNFGVSVLLVFFLSSSRETALLAVLPLALSVLLIVEQEIRLVIKKFFWLSLSSLMGLISVFLFNIWKYGSWSNEIYADPIRRVPGLVLKLKNFMAIWISPSGGVLPFWFLGGVLAISIPLVAVVVFRHEMRKALAASLLLGNLFVQTALLSAWFAPFGWVTWGPRLIMPTVGAVLFASFTLFPEIVQKLIDFVRYKFALVAVLLLATYGAGLSNLGFILDRAATLSWFTPPLLPRCTTTANIETDPDFYWSCALDFAPWQLGRTLWDSGIHQVTAEWALIYFSFTILIAMNVFSRDYSSLSATSTRPPASEGNREIN
jgi:hypothetical protein